MFITRRLYVSILVLVDLASNPVRLRFQVLLPASVSILVLVDLAFESVVADAECIINKFQSLF